jgi:host factor-I protein
MTKQTNNLQDVYINNARKDKVDLTVFLMNGVPIRGRVISFDNYTILLEVDKKQNLIFKHAISTIVPVKPIPYGEQENG